MESLHASNAPAAVGPYSPGLKAGKTIYVSGQLPVKDGQQLTEIGEATTACLNNVLGIIEAGGGRRESIVKCVVFIRDMALFGRMNEAYAAFFGGHKPARSCIQVSGLPKDAIVEVEAVAVVE